MFLLYEGGRAGQGDVVNVLLARALNEEGLICIFPSPLVFITECLSQRRFPCSREIGRSLFNERCERFLGVSVTMSLIVHVPLLLLPEAKRAG